MADVFIGYASEDRDRVEILAKALAAQGWSVWWDCNIPFGKPFDQVIEQELTIANLIIVAWSSHSVKKNWVLEEATYARDKGNLVPILLDMIEIPLGFRRFQAANLSDWNGQDNHIEYKNLISLIISEYQVCSKNKQKGMHEPSETLRVLDQMSKQGTEHTQNANPNKVNIPYLIFNILKNNLGSLPYYTPNIPHHKMTNIISKCEVDKQECIVAILDCTVLGSAKDAFVFTDKGMHYHHISASPERGYILYKDFKDIFFSNTSLARINLTGNTLSDKNLNMRISIAGSYANQDQFLNVLEAIKITAKTTL